MKRKICCITGARADYGYLRPVMKKIAASKDLKLIPVATGMHFLKKFGYSIAEVRKDFNNIIDVPLKLQDDTGLSTCRFIAEGVSKMARLFFKSKPDVCLVLGDRAEVFAAIQAAAFQNIPIAHMHGGDITAAGLDEPIRHSISKFAHIHFPATKTSAKRLLKMGEEKFRIYVVGSSTVDELKSIKLIKKPKLLLKYGIDKEKPFILIVQHPVTTQVELARSQIRETLKAVLSAKIQGVAVYPNCDQGSHSIIEEIERYEEKGIISIPNLSRLEYLSFLNASELIMGNSSSAIIESAYYRKPAINIGTRQHNRERGRNVLDVKEHDARKIVKSIQFAMNNKSYRQGLKKCATFYGEGKTGEKICSVLSKVKIDYRLMQKRIVF